jgi:hypothetical protein
MSHPTRHTIWYRRQIEVNTDPQRRCYNGVHAKSELRWTAWGEIGYPFPEKVADRLKFWTELNEYAVSQRGESARCEYKATPPSNESTQELT